VADTNRGEPLAHAAGEAAAGLLHDDGQGQLAHEAGDRREAAREVAIAAGLYELHRGVQVDAQCIDPDAPHERFDLRGRHLPRLYDAEVAEDEGVRGDVTDGVRSRRLGAHVHRALAAETEAEALLLRDRGELAVDARGLVGPAGHRGDQEGSAQPLAEDRARRVDGVRIQVGQRVVDEPHLLEQRGLVPERDLVRGAQRQVVCFALPDRAHRRGLTLTYRNSSKKSETTRIRK
jgi:hypothetical protein